MLCDICKKNEATIHIKEIHNGQSHTSNLCESCAAEQEKKGEFCTLGFNLAEMLHNLGKLTADTVSASGNASETEENDPEIVCPGCGWTLEKIKRSGGRLGCPECYRAFGEMIADALSGVQRGTVHLGKRPPRATGDGRAALEAELESHQRELKRLIQSEEYEEAAVCRDRINQLKQELAELERKGDGK